MKSNILNKKEIEKRISILEEEITKAQEYLEVDAHAHWHKFRPLFSKKLQNGKEVKPHKDWVRNVFLPGREKMLNKAERTLDKFE